LTILLHFLHFYVSTFQVYSQQAQISKKTTLPQGIELTEIYYIV